MVLIGLQTSKVTSSSGVEILCITPAFPNEPDLRHDIGPDSEELYDPLFKL